MTCGIYIVESPSGNQYVGSSNNIEKRWYRHNWQLEKEIHHCKPLQRAFDKHGTLSFKILLICAEKDLLYYEQRTIEVMKPVYNVSKEAGRPMAGRKHTEESRLKMSATRSRPEFKARHSIAMKGRGHPSTEETNLKIRYAQADQVKCVELNKDFRSTFDAAQWCVNQGLAKSINCRGNINSATRKPESTAYGFHWIKIGVE